MRRNVPFSELSVLKISRTRVASMVLVERLKLKESEQYCRKSSHACLVAVVKSSEIITYIEVVLLTLGVCCKCGHFVTANVMLQRSNIIFGIPVHWDKICSLAIICITE